MGRRRCDEELAAHYATYPIEEEISPITVCRLQEIVASFAPYRRLGTLIDVGAGSGHLLEAASRAGWDAHAVEYGPQQRARLAAQGFRLRPPRLETEAAAGAFDVAVLQEVIEHLRIPPRNWLPSRRSSVRAGCSTSPVRTTPP
jgi:2-polyprenyl-3-methyl-5-hydroxy-6-metoxy-1,4-benzoquinol methylase